MKTAAIVVTYNRSNLLRNCLEAIDKQTAQPDILVVVDNSSTDDTPAVIEEFAKQAKFAVKNIRLEENMGGAGGFYNGLKYAHEKTDCDLFWVMDDDGVPADTCLEELVKYADRYDYVAPLVIDIADNQGLAFPYKKNFNPEEVIKNAEDGMIAGFSCPFNGILLSRKALDVCGYPKKELFIWGDEREYQMRMKANGFNPRTIVAARHYHPKDKLEYKKSGRFLVIDVDSELRNYCKYRNTLYCTKKYTRAKAKIIYQFAKKYVAYSYYYLTDKKSLRGWYVFNLAFFDAATNNFTRHKKFLKK